MIATSEDVARRAGVSRAAVSQILNGRGERFSAATRERVRKAAVELEYQPSAAGRALAKGSSDFVIVLIPNTTFGGNLQDLFETVTDELSARGLLLVLRLTTKTTAALDRLVAGVKPRAVVSLTALSDEERALLSRRGVLAVDPTVSSRSTVNHEIGELQGRHLIDRGYTRIAVARLHDARQDPFGDARLEGVRAACRHARLPEPAAVQLRVDLDEAVAALDELDTPGLGIACYNDDVARALVSAAQVRSRGIPSDIGVIGMDHTPLSQAVLPRLTTISYDTAASVQQSVSAILVALGEASPLAALGTGIGLRLVPGDTT